MANPLSDFVGDHHVIMGVALMTIGVFGAYGSITGRLPSMLAALFDSKDMVQGGKGKGPPSVVQNAVSAAGVNPGAPGGGAAPAFSFGNWLHNETGLPIP